MSEIRRKLVIVGDGACGKVRIASSLSSTSCSPPSFQTCLLIVFSKGTFPEVRLLLRIFYASDPPISRSMCPPSSKTTSPTSRWTANTSNSPYGILPARKTTTVSAPSATPILMSSSSVSQQTPQIPSITSRRRFVSHPRSCLFLLTDHPRSGSPR